MFGVNLYKAYSKGAIKVLSIVALMLNLLPWHTWAQMPKNVLVAYQYAQYGFHCRIDFFEDYTFVYKQSSKLGSTKSTGNWRFVKDTFKLFNYQIPWRILSVTERKADTINGKSVVKVVTAKDSTTAEDVYDFPVWVNNNCKNRISTSQTGLAIFNTINITDISIDYNEYKVKDTASNYFVLTISCFPIYSSPGELQWKYWKKEGKVIHPIECGHIIPNLTLVEEQ